MKNLLTSAPNPMLNDLLLLGIRIFVGVAMLTHGYPKLQMLVSGQEIQFMSFLGLSEKFSLFLTVIAEFLCSLLIIIGLFTRISSIPLIITMLVAIFVAHANDGFDKKEMASLYLFLYFVLFILGPGRISVDHLISRKR